MCDKDTSTCKIKLVDVVLVHIFILVVLRILSEKVIWFLLKAKALLIYTSIVRDLLEGRCKT